VDVNVRAFRTVVAATSDEPRPNDKRESQRQGGLKGGPARARAISRERRVEIARKANAARWKPKSKRASQ
jgi:hypothetical protein